MPIKTIADLTPDARNARKHNPRNIGMIATAMQKVGAARSIVIDEDGAILAGNGTVEAAGQAGIERVKVVDADGETIIAVRRSGLTVEQKQELALYDNRTAELATWDSERLGELAGSLDLTDMFSAQELARVLGQPDPNAYTAATHSPVYTPTGENPAIESLIDTTRRDDLLDEIDAADLSDDLRSFLIAAATRHVVFDYRRIAEFYAHADAQVQRLMENSALVIVDFDRAIELGYVKLTDRLAAILDANGDDEDEDDDA